MPADFLTFVREHLAHLGPSRFEEVAKKTGVSLGTIRKIHYGEVADPRIGSIQPLHDFFTKGGAEKLMAKAA